MKKSLAFEALLPENTRLVKAEPLGGGNINTTYKLVCDKANYFIKYNDLSHYPEMMRLESKSLILLKEKSGIRIPEVIREGIIEDTQYLLLEHIERGMPAPGFWINFGRQLAEMHIHNTQAHFGLSFHNYIGSLPQNNSLRSAWVDFFILNRILPQSDLALKNGLLSTRHTKALEALFKRLGEIFPKMAPSLLHGDLWSGNFLIDFKGNPVLIDPAMYYGHPEMELAFTRLFGGFDSKFYDAYISVSPMEPGFEDRVDIYNLYPLLVHLNLFGLGYLRDIEAILRRY